MSNMRRDMDEVKCVVISMILNRLIDHACTEYVPYAQEIADIARCSVIKAQQALNDLAADGFITNAHKGRKHVRELCMGDKTTEEYTEWLRTEHRNTFKRWQKKYNTNKG